MSAPRVFISSTFYDLHHVRNDIDNFLRGIGYDPIMNEKGSLTFSQTETLEKSCYTEVEHSDIVVCIIGGRFGAGSDLTDKSITMTEIDTAIKAGKLMYIFIEKNVFYENQTYETNDGKIKPFHADNVKIHEYISSLRKKVKNHPIETFESSSDITNHLKQQLAGKFQQLIQREANASMAETAISISESTRNLKSTIDEIMNSWEILSERLSTSYWYPLGPIQYLKNLLCISYDICIGTKNDLIDYLKDLDYSIIEENADEIVIVKQSINKKNIITINQEIFDEIGCIRNIRKISTLQALITFTTEDTAADDGLPF